MGQRPAVIRVAEAAWAILGRRMPLDYELREQALWFTTRGDVDYSEGLATLESAIREAAVREPDRRWHVVFDIRLSSEDRSAKELRGIADFVAGQRETLSGRCVIIADPGVHFGLARMFGAYSESHGIDVNVVRDSSSAERWLRESA